MALEGCSFIFVKASQFQGFSLVEVIFEHDCEVSKS
jgi:hypothetical protein